MPRRKRDKEREPRPSSCIGCGEAASGYYYDAPSCVSCKSFFRRAVVKRELFPGCSRVRACDFNLETNQDKKIACLSCRSCRYYRCVNGGMNQSLLSNSRSPYPNAIITRRSSVDEELVIVMNPLLIEFRIESNIQCLLVIEKAHHQLRMSTYAPQLVAELTVDEFLSGPSKLGDKFKRMKSQPYEPSTMNFIPVEIIINNKIVMEMPTFDYTVKKFWYFQDIVYSIAFIKALPVYHQLDDCCKRSLLVSSALVCSDYTSAFFSYSHHADRTCYPDGCVMSWSKEIQDQSPHSTRFHTALIAAMREAELDTHEYVLLKVIIICTSSRGCNHHSDVLQNEKERCAKSLLSYVLSRRGVDKGPMHFAKILAIVDLSTKLNFWQKSQHILAMAMGLYKKPAPFLEEMFHS